MAETVIREVTKDVWTFSRPFLRLGFIPIGGRSTAVKLSNGDLWVMASTPLDASTKAKLDELGGRVKYIIGPDAVHHLYLSEFKEAYPDAKLLGVPGHLENTSLQKLKFDGVYGKDPAGTQYGFEKEIQSCYFSGFQNQDVAFNHITSKTLLQADLLFNLPATEQYSASSSSFVFNLFNRWMNPSSRFHKHTVWNLATDREAMKRDARTVADWQFDRIIPCHGDVIEKGGKNAWLEVYKWYLQ